MDRVVRASSCAAQAERAGDARRRIFLHVDVARRLEGLKRSGKVATLLLQDSGDLLVPVRRLPEPTLLLVQLDRLLQRSDGNCRGCGGVNTRESPRREGRTVY